jgi:hypothetical protein
VLATPSGILDEVSRRSKDPPPRKSRRALGYFRASAGKDGDSILWTLSSPHEDLSAGEIEVLHAE